MRVEIGGIPVEQLEPVALPVSDHNIAEVMDVLPPAELLVDALAL